MHHAWACRGAARRGGVGWHRSSPPLPPASPRPLSKHNHAHCHHHHHRHSHIHAVHPSSTSSSPAHFPDRPAAAAPPLLHPPLCTRIRCTHAVHSTLRSSLLSSAPWPCSARPVRPWHASLRPSCAPQPTTCRSRAARSARLTASSHTQLVCAAVTWRCRRRASAALRVRARIRLPRAGTVFLCACDCVQWGLGP